MQRVMWTMKNAPTCINTAWLRLLHHLLRYITSTVEFTQNHNFQNYIHLICKITTATLTNLYKKVNPPHCPRQPSSSGKENMYGVMKITLCDIIRNCSHYQSTSSGQKEINTYITI